MNHFCCIVGTVFSSPDGIPLPSPHIPALSPSLKIPAKWQPPVVRTNVMGIGLNRGLERFHALNSGLVYKAKRASFHQSTVLNTKTSFTILTTKKNRNQQNANIFARKDWSIVKSCQLIFFPLIEHWLNFKITTNCYLTLFSATSHRACVLVWCWLY